MKRLIFACLLIALALPACALKYKTVAVKSAVAVEKALGSLQDIEFATCDASVVKPLAPATCTPAAAALGLTTARHQAFNAKLAKAFHAQGQLAVALEAYRAGDPAPASFDELATVVGELKALAKELGSNARVDQILSTIELVLTTMDDIAKAFPKKLLAEPPAAIRFRVLLGVPNPGVWEGAMS